MNTVREIKSAIIANSFTNEELTEIIQAVKFARAQLGKDVRRTLRLGCQVKFTSNRTGRTEVGVLKKIAIKNAKVQVGTVMWTVPMNMLEVV